MNGEINAEHYVGHHEELETIPEENDEDPSMTEQDDADEVDMIPYAPEESDDEPFNMAIDDTSEDGQTGHHRIHLRGCTHSN